MYDLIVAGAGPAGSTAARTAAMEGLDTLILEKETFPRYKPCGGALSDRAARLLDFSLPASLCERSIDGARVHYRERVLERHKGYRLTTLLTRSNFDHFLLQKAEEAGAKQETCKVLDFRDAGENVCVQTDRGSFQSRFLVVSSGCQDALKQKIQGAESKASMGICMVTEVEEDDELIQERLNSSLDIHFGVADNGYGWIFPHKGYYSVGIGGLASRLCHPRTVMKEFLKQNGFPDGQRLHGHTIPQGGNRRIIAKGRVLLAGDAAGYVDAFTGEGIYYAIRSGQIAARVIADVPAPQAAKAYQSCCDKDFGEELWYALIFSKIMHSYPDMFLRILACQEDVLDRYIEIAAAKRSYRDFVRWLVPRLPLNLLRAL
ncbi:Digeranylgeranylglycerophospholipid reductase [uncultured archaeon]|nr:Digeranylgeranylglycerophospholipid reductase [uncultured archaeon]